MRRATCTIAAVILLGLLPAVGAGAGETPSTIGTGVSEPASPDGAGAGEPASPDGLPLRLVLALDGIPYDLFVEMQREGHFAGFFPVGRLVSTFPSLSDATFAVVGGTEPPEGYQVMRFDRETNRVVGNTVKSLSSAGHPPLHPGVRVYGSWHRMVSYVTPYHSSLRELRRTRDDFLRSSAETFVAKIESTDALLHVQGRKDALRFLARLDDLVEDLSGEVYRRTGRALLVDFISDHGSTMHRGKPVKIERRLEACGFERARSLQGREDVAYSLAGIIGAASIVCQPGQAEAIADCMLEEPGVDFCAFVREDAVVVRTPEGEAEVRQVPGPPEAYVWRILRGDPLGYGEVLGVPPGEPRPADAVQSQGELFSRTADLDPPDAPRRLWRTFHGVVKEPGDVLVSLRDGYESGNAAVRFLAKIRGRYGTHGSLTRASSLGILASNWRSVPDSDPWLAREFLFGEPTREALRATPRQGPLPRAVLENPMKVEP